MRVSFKRGIVFRSSKPYKESKITAVRDTHPTQDLPLDNGSKPHFAKLVHDLYLVGLRSTRFQARLITYSTQSAIVPMRSGSHDG